MSVNNSKSSSKMTEDVFDNMESIIQDIREGKLVILTDDEDRENEGDFIVAAEKATAESINFMATYGRGLICVPIKQQRAKQLGLQSMVLDNRESFKTDFTISVDAVQGVTTGISAPDRAQTIKMLSSEKSKPEDFVQPGHVFPLQAKNGGVLQRAGHTEAAVDLARLAGLDESAVICEILKEDGTMARLPDLIEISKKFDLKISTIQQLIEYRRRTEKLIECVEKIKMPTDYGMFDLYMYRSILDDSTHLALVMGEVGPDQPALVRVHSECLTGDVFGSRRCDCGNQLHDALVMIQNAGSGVLVYMRQEGRGIGLAAKIHAYKLQEQGMDTVEANIKLGYPADLREYGLGAQILHDLGVRKMRLMTNNPKKVVGLAGYGLDLVDQVPIKVKPNEHNENYLYTKKERMGHRI
ncbi:MAG: bifunctional 3,4-dihydroxy-2-butanone-4-phosphate synthase/GTP cyclohydrolase II [Verrucomicrobiota bacterium]